MKLICLGLLLLPLIIYCNECENAPRVDCVAPNTQGMREEDCVAFGCTWCPVSEDGEPWCVAKQQACASVRNDCFNVSTSGVDKNSCVANPGCSWCPNPAISGDPWCIRDSSSDPPPPAICTSDHGAVACDGGNVQSDAATCNAIDKCVWCSLSQPRCLNRVCLKEIRYDCYWENRSGINKNTCEGNGNQCTWCPSPKDNSNPWCVESCPTGQTLRYRQTDSCCVGTPTQRIIGGRLASDRWPWMGALFDDQTFMCGAVLITPTAAITAAHCFDNPLANPRLQFGIINLLDASERLQSRDVANGMITNHPSYVVGLNDYDIAILDFTEPINVMTQYVNVIDLPTAENLPVGTKCFVAGWGDVEFQMDQISVELREVEVDIIDFEQCKAAYNTHSFLNDVRQICAGKPDGGADACQGDSGGPLMCQRQMNCDWFLAGIVSFGTGCGDKDFPGVYTRIAGFEAWLMLNR